MKSVSVFLFRIFILNVLSAQTINEQNIKADIESAVVYLTASELTHVQNINLAPGTTKLTFTDISEKIQAKSIRVTTHEDIDILSISSKINYLTDPKEMPRIKQLKDSLKLLSERVRDEKDMKDAYVTEKNMLMQNLKIGGESNGVPISELKAASAFYRSQIAEINKAVTKIEREIRDYNLSSQRLKSELSELNAEARYARAEVEIMLSAPRALKTDVELKYIVGESGWSPTYDLKAVDTDEEIELTYRGRVFNNTGVNWEDIKITLSTADPTLSVSKPILRPWYLNEYAYSGYNSFGRGEGYTQNMIVVQKEKSEDMRDADYDYNESNVTDGLNITGTDYAQTAVPELSAEFDIVKRMSVPADDKPYPVEISKHTLPANYKHFAVTKMDKDVFLLARIAGWEDLNMVDGPVNVYYSGTYLGQSFISTRDVKDTLDMSLGRDAKVLVTRSKLKEFSSTKIIGSKRRETLTYELVAKNNRKSEIELEILDQIPISQTEDIKVKALETSGAVPNATTGELSWKMKLKPGESQKIRLSFQIEYPKDQRIEIKQKKSQNVRYKF